MRVLHTRMKISIPLILGVLLLVFVAPAGAVGALFAVVGLLIVALVGALIWTSSERQKSASQQGMDVATQGAERSHIEDEP